MNRRIFLYALGSVHLGLPLGAGYRWKTGYLILVFRVRCPNVYGITMSCVQHGTELIRRSRGIATPILSVWVMETRVFGLHRK